MRREIHLWWEQATKDFSVAEKMFNEKEYYMVAFLCHEAIEKSLKALYLRKKSSSAGFTHSLLALGKSLGASDSIIRKLRDFSMDYLMSRYPDATDELPYKIYDEKMAAERLEGAREVLNWIEKELKL